MTWEQLLERLQELKGQPCVKQDVFVQFSAEEIVYVDLVVSLTHETLLFVPNYVLDADG